MKLPWKKSLIVLTICLYTSIPAPAFEIQVDLQDGPKRIDLSSTYLKSQITYSFEIRVTRFLANTQEFLWPRIDSQPNPEISPGSSLVLYADNPNQSTRTLDLPKTYSASKEVLDVSTVLVTVQSKAEDPAPVSIKKTFRLTSYESLLQVETTLKNETDHEMVVYPADVFAFNTEFGISTMPNSQFTLFAPIQDATAGLTVLQADSRNNPFTIVDAREIFALQNKISMAEAKITQASPWFAVQLLKNGQTLGLEYQFPGPKPEPISDNIHLFLNGVGDRKKNDQLIQQGLEFAKYAQIEYRFGKVVLKPSDSFTYNTTWTTSVCPGPIIQLENGILVNHPFEIYYGGMGFYAFASLGIPQEGVIKLEFYNNTNNVLKTNTPSLSISNNKVRRPYYAVPAFPTILQHEIWFSPEADPTQNTNDNEYVLKNTESVRMTLSDFNGNPIRTLSEVHGSWKQFEMPATKKK